MCKTTWYRNFDNPDVIESVEECVQNRIESAAIESIQIVNPFNDNISPNESIESEDSDDEINLESL